MIRKNKRFKNVLNELDVNQRTLARLTGIPESYISHFANGRMRLSQVEQAKIAQALGVDSREIFSE